MSKSLLLKDLQKECLLCRKCSIGGQRIGGHLSNVFSNMCIRAKILVVGQNPGMTEIERRKPFVGISGAFFDKAIKDVLGVERDKFYISNAVRCYTEGNRPPTDQEVNNCRYFLDKEIEIIKPKIIVTLGNFGLKQIMGRTGISGCHGTILDKDGIPVLPLFHPSPLNTNRPEVAKQFYEDLLKLRDYL